VLKLISYVIKTKNKQSIIYLMVNLTNIKNDIIIFIF